MATHKPNIVRIVIFMITALLTFTIANPVIPAKCRSTVHTTNAQATEIADVECSFLRTISIADSSSSTTATASVPGGQLSNISTSALTAGEPILVSTYATEVHIATGPHIFVNSLWPFSGTLIAEDAITTSSRPHKFFTGQIPTPHTTQSSTLLEKTDSRTFGGYSYCLSSVTIIKRLPTPTPTTATLTCTDEILVPLTPTTLITLRSTLTAPDASSSCITTLFKSTPLALGPTSISYAAIATQTKEFNCAGCALAVVNPLELGPVVNYTTTVDIQATQTVDKAVCASSPVSTVTSSLSNAPFYCKRGEEHCG